MESKKRVYNDRFLYADPLAKSSSRSTRYRLSKKRKAEEGDLCCSTGNDATAEAVPVDAHCGDMCDYVRLGTSNDPSEREPDVKEVHSKEISGLGNEVEVLPVVHNAIELQSALPDENVIGEYYDEELDQEGGERDSDNVVCLHEAGYDMEGAGTAVEEPLFSGCPLTAMSSSVLVMQFKKRTLLKRLYQICYSSFRFIALLQIIVCHQSTCSTSNSLHWKAQSITTTFVVVVCRKLRMELPCVPIPVVPKIWKCTMEDRLSLKSPLNSNSSVCLSVSPLVFICYVHIHSYCHVPTRSKSVHLCLHNYRTRNVPDFTRDLSNWRYLRWNPLPGTVEEWISS